MSNTRIN